MGGRKKKKEERKDRHQRELLCSADEQLCPHFIFFAAEVGVGLGGGGGGETSINSLSPGAGSGAGCVWGCVCMCYCAGGRGDTLPGAVASPQSRKEKPGRGLVQPEEGGPGIAGGWI